MKKLLFTTLVLGFATSSLVFAENRISGGIGASAAVNHYKIRDTYNTSYPFLIPTVDAEIGVKLNELLDLKLQGSMGVNIFSKEGQDVRFEATPMLTAKVTDKLKLSSGMKFKHTIVPYFGENNERVTANSKSIYAEARTKFNDKTDGYVGLSKSIDDQGFDVKLGVMRSLGTAQ
ncbi:MAG: hypothetical protein U0T83_01890 [Bacteriovoracaceae bacterium]